MLRNNADARRCSYFELGLPVVTQKSIEVRLHNKCHKIYLSGPLEIFYLYVILTISCLACQHFIVQPLIGHLPRK